jgi:hypothetical protein
MTKYKFIKYKDPDNSFDDTNVAVEVEADTLDNILQAFEDFLRGAGFGLTNQTIEAVKDEG